jgi:hypothetical protein
VEVLSCLFRGLFLAKLVAAHRARRLKFFGVHAHLDDARAFKAYLARLRKIECVVYAKRPFGGPKAVLAYVQSGQQLRQEFHAREDGLACEQADITVTLPKPMTSGAKSDGRFGKQDFVYVPTQDVYRCPAGEKLTYRYTNEEDGKTLRRYWTTACLSCPLKAHAREVLNAASRDGNTSTCLRVRRETVEHPFGTLKMRMGATHFLMKRLPKVATEMALHVLAYNLTRVINIVGVKPLIAAIQM